MIIYIATSEEWEKIKGQTEFASDDFHIEGFIHCSYPKHTIGTIVTVLFVSGLLLFK